MRADEIIVQEVFDSNVQGKLVRATNDLFTTRAEIAGRSITFNASRYEQGMEPDAATVWEIEFTERTPGNLTYGKSGSGAELQVFAFVIESLKELISRYQPELIEFSSHKADGNRTSLYRRIGSKIKIPGYKLVHVDSSGTSDMFNIVRDK